MIYITGDTHGNFHRFTKGQYGKHLTEDDIVIVTGDFGLLWSKDKEFEYWRKFFETQKYTVLWVAGNHDNYNWIIEYPVEEWNGGKVRKIIGDKCIYLERGQVFNIEGQNFFTFGGASSHDIQGGVLDKGDPAYNMLRIEAIKSGLPYRVLNESWWKQELPTAEEMQEGLNNLAMVDNQVDYIITHCCSTSIQDDISGGFYKSDILTDYFEKLESVVNYNWWFFGHYHDDKQVNNKHYLLYEKILPLSVLHKVDSL